MKTGTQPTGIESGPAPGRPCGLLRRLAIIIYDAVVVIALLMLAAFVAMLAGFPNRTALKDPAYTLYLLLVWFVYVTWCWQKGGMTLGMRAWRVRIVNNDGNRPGWKHCTIRFAMSLVSAAAVGAGFFWSLFEPHGRAWHDTISSTRLTRF